jgi:hypothetical protein
MMRRTFTAVLLMGLAFGVLAALPTNAAPAPDAAKIDKLIEQLGSAKFDEREQATKDLDAIGAPALEALRKATKSADAEVRMRSTELVKAIEKRAETETVLKPTKVHLVFKDTPVPEAVEEFKKKSGYLIVLHDPENKLKERKITLDTGETTFWKAFDQFCEKAGVHEASQQELFQPVPLPPGGPVPPGLPPIQIQPVPPIKLQPLEKPAAPTDQPQKAAQQGARAAGALAADEKPTETKPAAPPAAQPAPPVAPPPVGGPAQGVRPVPPRFVPQQPGQITLVDGKPEVEATDYSSAVRVRALTKPPMFGNAPEGEILFALDISPEPKITWQRLIGVKLEKAIDDNEQKLGEAPPPNVPGINNGPFPGGGVKILPAVAPAIVRPNFANNLHQYTPIRLKKGEKASKSIKELTGTIAAEVLAEPKTLISTDDVLKSAGKTFKGDEGGSIKIVSVDKDEKANVVKVIFEFEQPAGFTPPINGLPGGIGGGPVPVPLPAPNPAPVPLPPAAAPGGKIQILPAPPNGALQAVQAQAGQAGQGQVVQVQVQGGGVAIAPIGRPGGFGNANGLKLVDDKGKPVEGQNITMQFKAGQPGAPVTPEWVLTFPVKKDQTEGGKLTYSASKSVTVDIPFALKDIVLP